MLLTSKQYNTCKFVYSILEWGRRSCDRMVAGHTITYVISTYHY